jgi:DNA modification methylase
MGRDWINKIVGHGEEAPDQLLAHPLNFRIHPKAQQDALAGVIGDIGYIRSVLVNKRTSRVIDGHLRVALALRDGVLTIPVEYVDLSEAEEAEALATIDPLAAMATHDAAKLADLLREVSTDNADVMALLDALATDAGIVPGLGEPGDGGDDFGTTPAEGATRTQVGDLWQLGRHRLLVDDCTVAANVARLMDGRRADIVVTDPPYGIKRDKGFGGADGFGGRGAPIARRTYGDNWDGDRPTQAAFDLLLAQAPTAIIFGGNFFADLLPQGRHWLVWDKQNTMPTFGDCELAWTNVKRTSVKQYTIAYNGLIGKEAERSHPTQKPIALMVAVLEDYTDGATAVCDSYLGSGTTLIAAERTGRTCYGCELEPRYADVVLRRWEAETNQTAVKISATTPAQPERAALEVDV